MFKGEEGNPTGETHRSLSAADSPVDGRRRSPPSFKRDSPSFRASKRAETGGEGISQRFGRGGKGCSDSREPLRPSIEDESDRRQGQNPSRRIWIRYS